MNDNLRKHQHAQIIADMLKRVANDFTLVHCPNPSRLFEQQSKGHFHLFTEVFFQISGKCKFVFPDYEIIIKPGDMLVIPAGLNHHEYTKEKDNFLNMVCAIHSERLAAHFAKPKTNKSFETFNYIPIHNKRCKYIADTCEELVSITLQEKFPEKQQTLHSLSIACLAMLLDVIESNPTSKKKIHPKISACKNHINNYLTSSELNVKSIAKNLKCSSDYLSHIFHRETGMTISQYINQNRLQFARRMLTESTLNVSQIAYACGFSDPAYFSRLFSKTTGISPREYRNQF